MPSRHNAFKNFVHRTSPAILKYSPGILWQFVSQKYLCWTFSKGFLLKWNIFKRNDSISISKAAHYEGRTGKKISLRKPFLASNKWYCRLLKFQYKNPSEIVYCRPFLYIMLASERFLIFFKSFFCVYIKGWCCFLFCVSHYWVCFSSMLQKTRRKTGN